MEIFSHKEEGKKKQRKNVNRKKECVYIER
jgi:hypothetical protein